MLNDDQSIIGLYVIDDCIKLYIDKGVNQTRTIIKILADSTSGGMTTIRLLNSETLRQERDKIVINELEADTLETISVTTAELDTFMGVLNRIHPMSPNGSLIREAFDSIGHTVDLGRASRSGCTMS